MTSLHSTDVRAVWTSDEGSMAYDTARTRWAKTVSQMVDDVEKGLVSTEGEDVKAEGSEISQQLQALEQDIRKDAPIRLLEKDGGTDVDAYNAELAQLGEISWCRAPWLYAECMLYRHVQSLFSKSRHWKGDDIFKGQKDWTFASSRVAVEELAARYGTVVSSMPTGAEEKRLLFEEMTQIALWGNATDLSLLSKLSLDDIQGLQGSDAIKKNQRNIVSNDIEAVWAYLSDLSPDHRRIDIVLDNSGFEFFTDLVYASYLLQADLADSIVLHVKDFPWFVSDVTSQDVESTLSQLESASIFGDREHLDPLAQSLRQAFQTGVIRIHTHPFWTTAHSFDLLPSHTPDLASMLHQSSLIVFKGDLNYRKLLGDKLWPYTTTFGDALGALGPGSGYKVLSLRTNKADVCVGLSSEEQVKRLDDEAPGSSWIRSGKYAVMSFSQGE